MRVAERTRLFALGVKMVAGDTHLASAKITASICFAPGPSAMTAASFGCAAERSATPNVAQHDRPPLSSNHVGRKPWRLDRLRDRRLPARHPAGGRGNPDVLGQAPARSVALHHPTP